MTMALAALNSSQLFDPASYFGPALDPGIASVIVALAIVVLSLVVAMVARIAITRYGIRLSKRTSNTFDDAIIPAFHGPVEAFIVATGVYIGLKTLSGLPDLLTSAIDPAYAIAVIYIAAFQVSRLAQTSLNWYQREMGSDGSSKLNVSMLSFLKKACSVIIYAAATLMVLAQLHVEITPLLASAGIAGIAVALAAQELLSNVFGAFAILADKPYKVGDRIALSTGEYGDVLDIGLRSTRILTLDNNVIVVPNAEISKSRISNYSEPDPRVRYKVKVGIAYSADVSKASNILLEIAASTEGALMDPAPTVYIDSLGDFSVNLVLLVWGKTFRDNWNVPDKIYRQTLLRFAAEGIEIPFPVTTIRLSEGTPCPAALIDRADGVPADSRQQKASNN